MEKRSFQLIELRANEDNTAIEGYASVFNKKSEDLGGFREIIKPGAFKDAIPKSDVRALFNHDPNFVLGRTTNGTLELSEDDKGLKVRISPIMENSWVKDLVNSMKRGDIDQMSFGFTVEDDNFETVQGENIRTINKVQELFDVSPVTYPAYPQTSVSARMKKSGIDIDKLEVILAKEERSKEEIEVIDNAIEILNKFKPVVEEDGAKSENELKYYKRKLKLAEINLKE